MINNDILLEILTSWSFWDRPLPDFTARSLALPETLSPKIATVIQGVRRCGKSTLLIQFIKHYHLDPKHCVFVNFEDPRLADHLNHELLEAIYQLWLSRNKGKKELYFFFDEIQNVELWEKWIHAKLERPRGHRFIITGSNASLLAGELASSLTGRYQKIELYPFDFDEYRLIKPKGTLDTYLNAGGFPLPITTDNPHELLRTYFDDILTKDILARRQIRSPVDLRRLVKIVYESAGSEISYRKLSALTGVTVDTVISYLHACELAYLLFPCGYFTYSEGKRTKRNKKYYPIDPGIRNSVVTRTGRDLGKSFETLVFLHLKKKYREVFYWKGNGEVDFVVQNEEGLTPVQVTYETLKPRHEAALKEFYENFPQANEAIIFLKKDFEQ